MTTPPKQGRIRWISFIVVSLAVAGALYLGHRDEPPEGRIETSKFTQMLSRGQVASAIWEGREMRGRLEPAKGESYVATVPELRTPGGAALAKELRESGVDWSIVGPPIVDSHINLGTLLGVPLVILTAVCFVCAGSIQMRLN
jgi:hypothetical protein